MSDTTHRANDPLARLAAPFTHEGSRMIGQHLITALPSLNAEQLQDVLTLALAARRADDVDQIDVAQLVRKCLEQLAARRVSAGPK